MFRLLVVLVCVVAIGYGLLLPKDQTNSTTKSTNSTTNALGSTTNSATKSTDSATISTTKPAGSTTISKTNYTTKHVGSTTISTTKSPTQSTGYASVSATDTTIPTSGYTIDHLVSWILEEKLQRALLEKKLANLTNEFKKLEQTAAGMNQTGQTSTIGDNVTTTLGQLHTKLDNIGQNCKQNSLDIAYLNQTAENIEKGLKNISANTVAKSDLHSYAFSAHDITNGSPFVGDDLVFSKIQLNENNVYNNKTGKFTAPVSGLYVFHATMCTQANKYIYANIVAHGKDIGILKAGDEKWPDCSSESATALLQKGDQVFLRTMDTKGGPAIFDDISPLDSFSGHLLSQLNVP